MTSAPVTLAIVEDNQGTRDGLVQLFSRIADIKCLGAFASGEAAVQGIPGLRPQVALVDINLPGMSGIECVSQLKAKVPQLHMLMLTTYEESDQIFNSLRAGANGYLLKNMPAEELVQAVRDVHAGGSPMSMQIARKVVAHFHQMKQAATNMEQLSVRENEILRLLAKGCLYKEIAEQLGITMSTVRTHIHAVYGKLHVQTRTEAVLKFLGRES
jgi:DNA-binding NarL/FixJ family response regulator